MAPATGGVTQAGQVQLVRALAPGSPPTLADPNGRATFGFTVKCCAATGNLEYNDHAADVRIKAQAIDGLVIGSPGTSCPATPGSQHARFTGTAEVIRSIGTTMEPFTVDVDDCGEPGTSDTFGIKTCEHQLACKRLTFVQAIHF